MGRLSFHVLFDLASTSIMVLQDHTTKKTRAQNCAALLPSVCWIYDSLGRSHVLESTW